MILADANGLLRSVAPLKKSYAALAGSSTGGCKG